MAGEHPEILDVFKYAGRPFGHHKTRILNSNEYATTHLYVLNNCEEVTGQIMRYLPYQNPRLELFII